MRFLMPLFWRLHLALIEYNFVVVCIIGFELETIQNLLIHLQRILFVAFFLFVELILNFVLQIDIVQY